MFKSVLLLLVTNLTFAAIPTGEGLFRNSSNSDISGNLVLLNLVIDYKKEVEEVPLKEGESKTQELVEEKKTPDTNYLKLLLNNEDGREGELLQVHYADRSFSPAKLFKVKHIRSVNKLLKDEKNIDKEFFYSLVMMFSMNSSVQMKNFLKKYSPDFKSNTEMLNKNKMVLLSEYKKYLSAIKSDETLKEHLTSPLVKEDEEESKKVKELMDEKMYAKANGLDLVKKGDEFFWKLSFENGEAFFTNEDHQLTEMHLLINEVRIDLFAFDYKSYDGQHIMPQRILLKKSSGESIDIKVISYKDILSKKTTFYERVKKYNESLEKVNFGETPLPALSPLTY